MSQPKTAAIIGWSRQASVSDWEKGKVEANLDLTAIRALASAFSVTPDELIESLDAQGMRWSLVLSPQALRYVLESLDLSLSGLLDRIDGRGDSLH